MFIFIGIWLSGLYMAFSLLIVTSLQIFFLTFWSPLACHMGEKLFLSTKIMSSNQNLIKSIHLSSVTWGGPISRAKGPCIQKCEHSRSNWNLEVLVFRRGENRITRKKTSRSREENQQQTVTSVSQHKVIQRADRGDAYYSKTREYTDSWWYLPLLHTGQNYWVLIGWDRGHFFP